MEENTNKTIAINSFILYFKMIINIICSILTTRYALIALGIVDFGLYSLLGGVVSFVTIFNTIMITASNRFIAVAIGKKNLEEINTQFNVNLFIQVGIVFTTLVVAYPLGNWYINNYVNYAGDLSNAIVVYDISILASVISFLGVPYNGLLMAKEKFIIFSSADVISHIGKLIVAYTLTCYFSEKLLVYTVAMALFTVLPVLFYIVYCVKNFGQNVRLKLIKDTSKYKEVISFSTWVSIGAITMIGKNQGASMLVNAFFNTIMNTAMGVANNICVYINLFAQNVTQPMQPQITKSYVANDFKRTDELLLMSTKYSFLMMLFASSPFLVRPEWLLNLWLGEAPPYSIIFLRLMIVDNLIMSLNTGISNLIFASGKIKMYQLTTSILNLFSVLLGFIVLKMGSPAFYLIVVYIVFSGLRVVVVQYVLYKTLHYNNSLIIYKSYIPSLIITVLFVPIVLLELDINPVLNICLSMSYLCSLILLVGLNRNEKLYIRTKVMECMKLL